MANTVVGIFDGAREADNAVERLVSSGISRNNIDVTSGATGSDSSYVSNDRSDSSESNRVGDRRVRDEDGEERTVDAKGRNTNRITDFFNNLFGQGSDDAKRHTTVGSSSNSIVTVHAQSSDEAETAADILDDCGAIDVDERAQRYGFEKTSGTIANEASSSTVQDTLEGRGSRIRSRIVERPVDENIRLREENVRPTERDMEKTKGNHNLSGNSSDDFDNDGNTPTGNRNII